MPRRRRHNNVAAAFSDTLTLTVLETSSPILEEAMAEEYQKLSEKLDDVMSKIKVRKSRKK